MGHSPPRPKIPSYIQISQEFKDLILNNQVQPQNPPNNNADNEINKLATILSKKKLKFKDTIFGNSNLLPPQFKCQWMSIHEVFPSLLYKTKNNWYFQYSNELKQTNFHLAMKWLQDKPELLKIICINFEDQKKIGMYRFMLCLPGLKGALKKQILIDDQIPVDFNKNYLFKAPRNDENGALWPILLEKAFAKVVGRYLYNTVPNLEVEQILGEITGYPDYRFYQTEKKKLIIPQAVQIEPKKSLYYKFVGKRAIFSLWFEFKANIETVNTNLIFEIFEAKSLRFEDRSTYSQIKTLQQIRPNAIIIKDQKSGAINFPLPQVFLHIYNRGKQLVQFNLEAQSNQSPSLSQQNQKNVYGLKKIAIIKQLDTIKSQIFQNQTRYKMRFVWLGHRGAFCFTNITNQQLRITLTIKPQFFGKIGFEDGDHKILSKQKTINPSINGIHEFFIIVREENKEYGQFYLIQTNQN